MRVDAAAPPPVELGALAASLPPTAWHRHTLSEGAKGPLVAEVACLRAVAVRERLPGPAVWVVLRRSLGPGAELKAFLSNAPADIPAQTLAQRSAARWPVERAIEEGKGEVGLDHDEVRGWVGWHHHVTLSFLAHHFLVAARLRLGEKKAALTVPQVRMLLQVVLPRPTLTAHRALALLHAIQRQNHNAHRSHRKHTLRRLLNSS